MTEPGRGLQIVDVTSKHSYVLDEAELAQLLLSDDIKDLPVVVVSVAGAYRGGKSFLLNFFLRYLSSPKKAREDGSWLGEDSAPLVGFKWRSGRKATTMGVLMWSEPFVNTLPSGERVAVLLVDTQGNFDNRSSIRDNSTIFALSTLVSSLQIYNISQDIREDHLQHLELFTEYGKLVNSGQKNQKAFQVLEFLVRDWQFPNEEYPYGAVGGERLLNDALAISEDQTKEMKELRNRVKSSFERVSCFLMPHPGFEVLKSTYKGNINEIKKDFRAQLIVLVNSIFSPQKLLPKKINGEQVKARELFNYFKTYVELFNSDKIPNPTNILAATVKAGLLSVVSESRDVYEKGMNSEIGTKKPGVAAVDLKELHNKYIAAAKDFFNKKKKMGTEQEAAAYLNKLAKELDERLPQFLQANLSKIQAAIDAAREAYQKYVKDISRSKAFCVHPKNLESVHKSALSAAISVYDSLVKRITAKPDEDRGDFILGLDNQYASLRQENEKNNKMNVTLVRMEYWERMLVKASQEPPLSDVEFKAAHKKELEQALKDFDSKRSMPNQYTEDVYKFQLTEACQESYVHLKALNKSKNKVAMQKGIAEYNQYMQRFANNDTQCMHPDDLLEVHQMAVCRALTAFHPNKECAQGFDLDDEDEKTLKDILDRRYAEFKINNEAANETAVQVAYNEYVTVMDDKTRFRLWKLVLIIPWIDLQNKRIEFHQEYKQHALEKFNASRRDGAYHSVDPYRSRLERLMDEQYERNYKWYHDHTIEPFYNIYQNHLKHQYHVE